MPHPGMPHVASSATRGRHGNFTINSVLGTSSGGHGRGKNTDTNTQDPESVSARFISIKVFIKSVTDRCIWLFLCQIPKHPFVVVVGAWDLRAHVVDRVPRISSIYSTRLLPGNLVLYGILPVCVLRKQKNSACVPSMTTGSSSASTSRRACLVI